MTYYSLIYLFLIYAIPIWGSSNATDLQTILVMQKKVVRLITFNDDYPVEAGPLIHSAPLFKELGILTINDIFQLQTAKFVHDCINLNCPSQFQNYFLYPTTTYNTHDIRNHNLKIPKARTKSYGLNSVKNKGVHIWNKIPQYIRETRVKTFIKLQKKPFSVYCFLFTVNDS